MALLSNDFVSLENSSEELMCTSCLKKDLHIVAEQYCVECKEHFCMVCVEFHSRLSSLKGHKLLERSQFRSIDAKAQPILTVKCKKHPDEFIKMYCAIHKQVECTVCMIINHRYCVDIHYIPDIVDKVHKLECLDDVKETIRISNDQLQDLLKTLQKADSESKYSRQCALDAIIAYRKEINKMLDELENNSRQEIETQHCQMESRLKSQIHETESMMQKLDEQKNALCSVDTIKSHQFIMAMLSKNVVNQAGTLIRTLRSSPVKPDMKFKEDETLKACMRTISSLGIMFSSSNSRNKRGLYTVKLSSQFNVRVQDDQLCCSIYGTCFLESGHVLLADNRNYKLKLLNIMKKQVTSYCKLPAKPIVVCSVSSVEAVLSMHNHTLQFVSIGEQLVPTRSLTMSHVCWGLAINVSEMYISDSSTNVHVHSLDGTLLRTIDKNQDGKQMFSANRNVCVNFDGSIVHVTDCKNGLLSLDTNGKMLWRYTGCGVDTPYGIATDGCGNAFICGYHSHNVIQLGFNGDILGELVNQSHGLQNPNFISFDKNNWRLIVSKMKDDTILMFELE